MQAAQPSKGMEEALQKALMQMQEEIGQKDKMIEMQQEQLRKQAYAMSGGDP
jgi:hypothetical protein